MIHSHDHDQGLVVLSILIAIFSSYFSLDLAQSLRSATGKGKWLWLFAGSLAMGLGIWSMHFIGMLAFKIPGVEIYYDLPLMILSILTAFAASSLALFLVSRGNPTKLTYVFGSITMGVAISGMHYIGISSMRLVSFIEWDQVLVAVSILIAIGASYAALSLAFRLKTDQGVKSVLERGSAAIFMGLGISGMHYVGMGAMRFSGVCATISGGHGFLLASDNLALSVVVGAFSVLAIALAGSSINRFMTQKTLINDFLRQSLATRDEFLSIASHELKTPLTTSKLQIEFLKMRLHAGKVDQKDLVLSLESMDRSLDRMNSLIEDMLDLSKIKAGKLSFKKSEADLGKLVMDTVDRFQPQALNAGMPELNVKVSEVNLLLDPFRMEQVMANLLSNAIKYGKGNPVDVTLEKLQESVIVSVRDRGAGIPEVFREKLFQRFERAVNVSEISGLGLGLFITKEIVAGHEGKIWCESKEGEGTSFFVELPLV